MPRNKCVGQPVYLRNMISAFVFLEIIKSRNATLKEYNLNGLRNEGFDIVRLKPDCTATKTRLNTDTFRVAN